MKVTVLFFAAAADAAGHFSEVITLEPGTTAGQLRDRLVQAYPALARFGESLAVAVNREVATSDQVLGDGDEVALLPPMSGGGSNEPFVALTTDPIDPSHLPGPLPDHTEGAVVIFLGLVRGQTGDAATDYLDYDAYAPMAEQVMRQIAAEAADRFGARPLTVVHRVGRLFPGEPSVAVQVAAGHRDEAFSACKFIIDTIKERAPIWKKEHGPKGEYWV